MTKSRRKTRKDRKRKPSQITSYVPSGERRPAREPIDIDAGLVWFVAYCRARMEAKAAQGLTEAGIAVYLPTEVKESRHARRVSHRHQPLFSRYVFVGFPSGEQSFGAVRAVDGVEALVGVGGDPLRLPASLLVAIERRLRTRAAAREREEADIEARKRKGLPTHGFKPGDEVKVAGDLFASFAAVVTKLVGANQAKILLDTERGRLPVTLPVENLRAA